MSENNDKKRELTRDQRRALHAYECVREVANAKDKDNKKDMVLRKDYKILVNDLGARILRSGLAATMAFIERDKSKVAVQLFVGHILNAKIPSIKKQEDLFDQVREMDVDTYMLATRELLKVVTWLKRAVQAELRDDNKDEHD